MSQSRCAGILAIAVVSLTGPASAQGIFDHDFETGDTCAWSATVPEPCELCPDAGTVALWHLNRGLGQILVDASGNGRDLVLGPTTAVESEDPSWSQGRFGNGLSFSYHDLDYAVGNGSNTFPANQLTAELWAVPNTGTGSANSGQLFTAGFIRCFMTTRVLSNEIQVGIGNGATWELLTVSANPVDLHDGDWHYLAMTYDGSLLTVYVDGSPVGSRAATTVLGNASGYWIGGRPQNTFYDGRMDEIRLSDVARSAGDIAATWAASAACP